VTGVDAFLGTHDHIDHIDWPSWKVWKNTCPQASFILPEAVLGSRRSMTSDFPESRLVGLNSDTSYQIGDIKITAIPAAHEFLNQDPETGLYPCLQFIIEGYGMRIYHAGDTLRYEGMRPRLQQFGHIDAAILPINGRDGVRYRSDCIGNMTFQEAADLAGELGVGTVIPGHWNLFAHNSENPALFADYLEAKYGAGIRCVIPKAGEPIDLSC
ncbi:MAG: MBL fold metallo-hydrolase, partial [Lachnospiraceae bacterium]|nr:MBL fold metallo-hydrolase [Lachnospiraceae bacterium]